MFIKAQDVKMKLISIMKFLCQDMNLKRLIRAVSLSLNMIVLKMSVPLL